MKKIIFLIFFLLSGVLYSQGITDTLGNARIDLVTIYNNIHGTSHTVMSDICQYYTVTIYGIPDTTAIEVAYNDSSYVPMRTHTGDNYIGKFKATFVPNIWFKSWFTVASPFNYTVKFIEIIR